MRMRLRKRVDIIRIIIPLIILLILVNTFLIIDNYTNKSYTYLMNYAKYESNKITTILINNAINDVLKENDLKNITIIEKKDDEIVNIEYNSYKLNNLLTRVSDNIINNISLLEKGKLDGINTIFLVPSGLVYNMSIFNELGVKIPFKMIVYSNFDSFLDTTIKEYGINNSLVQTSIYINMNLIALFPFVSEEFSVNKDIVLNSFIIEGKIPDYYGGVITSSSPISTN